MWIRGRHTLIVGTFILVLTGIGVATAFATGWSPAQERAAEFGEQVATSDDSPVLSINDEVVTEEQFALELHRAEYSYESMKESVDTGTQSPSGSATGPEQEAFLAEWVDIFERVGVENIAMGSVIAETAQYSWALDQGYTASDAEIANELERQRELHERLAERPEEADVHEAFVNAMGEDYYWDKFLPQMVEQQIVTSKAHHSIVDAENEGAEPRDLLSTVAHKVELVESANIEILDSDVIDPETVERGREYIINDYRDLRNQQYENLNDR
jgi:hypothetical protein